MYKIILITFMAITFQLKGQDGIAKNLSVHYDELTAPDFVTAVEKSNGVCIIPMGIMEKHGAHLPLGTDMINIREIVTRAAMQEYVVVFPPYYFGQINEARQQPGTLAYSPQLIWKILQETCDELTRNGFSKIILVNGHGGNTSFLYYFVFSQNASPKSYALYLYEPSLGVEVTEKVEKMLQSELEDMHAGEKETSEMLAIRPDLVKLTRAQEQSGEDMARLSHLSSFFTPQWWYARFPNHYAGDAAPANAELGNFLVDEKVRHLAEAIMEVKADTSLKRLQEQYYRESLHPLNTKQ